jgi:tRNA A-37 threonylcarbamoyl transferase component Bud32
VTRLGQVTFAAHRTPWAFLAAAALLLALVGVLLDARLHDRLRGRIGDRLQLLHQSNLTALQRWSRDQSRLTAALAELPLVSSALRDVLASAAPAQRSEAAQPLALLLAPLLKNLGRHDWVLLDRQGSGVLQQSQLRAVELPLHRLPGALDALEKGARVGAPFWIDADLRARGLEGQGSDMWAWAPLRAGSAGPVAGVVGLRLDVQADFAEQLHSRAGAGSVESYAFDAQGLMLSASRFEPQLEALGLVPKGQSSAMHVSLRDPGGNLLDGFHPSLPRDEQPLTRLARAAITGKPGRDLDGYRDYRGVEVLGVWTWLGDMGLGLATEVDVAEAYDVLTSLRQGLWVLWFLLAVAALAAFFFSARATQLVREVEAAAELGQYKLLEKVGEGGMGAVYRARHAMLARPAAVKVLRAGVADAELSARFEREVRCTAELTHPNTISVYDFGRTPEGTFYYAMEFLDGVDLETLVEQHGPQPVGRVLHILKQAAGSLGEAHARGLIHRDVKPANLMLTVRGGMADFVKVLDFGLVRSVARVETKITQDDRVMGTPLYLAPEALLRPETIDARADLYALGVVAYYLLSGEDAFGANSSPEVITRQLSGAFRHLDERPQLQLPADVVELVHRLMAREPDERPASARALQDELEVLQRRHPWSRFQAASWWEAHTPVRRATADESAVTRLSVELAPPARSAQR